MTRRVAIAVFAALLVVSPLAGLAAAQAGNSTATPTPTETPTEADEQSNWTAQGPFSITELKTGGSHDPDAPPSVRTLYGDAGETPYGSVAVRYSPVSPLKDGYNFMEPAQSLESDIIQFYSTAFGEATGDYEVVIVYWQQEQKTVNGTTHTYAANQSVQRASLNVEEGYATADVQLKSQYDESWQATMWLEREGDQLPGARWRFKHKSNPLTAAPAFNVNSRGDLFRWAGTYVLLPGLLGIVLGGKTAKHFLGRTIRGPGKGTAFWAITAGVIALISISAATWQTAAVLARAPWVAGLTMYPLAVVVFLGLRDEDVEKAEFNHRDIEDSTTVKGEDGKETRFIHKRIKEIVRQKNELYMPKKGIRPFLARYWADPAVVPEEDVTTVNDCSGAVAKEYELDPGQDEVYRHKPARLQFSPTIVNPREDDTPLADGGVASAFAGVMDTLSRLNWNFLLPAIGGFAVVYLAVSSFFGTPTLGVLLGLLPGLVAGTHAEDGELSLEFAAYHGSDVRAILAQEQAHYQDVETFDQLYEMISEIDSESIEATQETVQAVRSELFDRMENMFHVPEVEPQQDSGSEAAGDD